MADLVKQLRYYRIGMEKMTAVVQIMHDAADEIERLQEKGKQLQEDLQVARSSLTHTRIRLGARM